MINKNKLKKFLKSNYSTQTKLFVLDVLKDIVENPTTISHFAMYIYDLDIFEESFIKIPNNYYVIDFMYLESLDNKIREYYLAFLSEGIDINIFNVNDTTILIEHGILLTNIEHLKMKRQKKLEKVESRFNDDGWIA